ncbi:glycogen synthase GlgA [Gilvimarinus algae]|uniref:Glycogen synthase n=1 Tax=Gilvimarinus algae TaxID=3058037 RepID=A0ABT8TEF8_9GAMM|nr:glycogen synthase GlgA [Gilvimarinus sp. SDUM040014]MDO3382474.1 glycogen synthase GlgA [Gilvimarinus sp. SDUM040014]
MKLLYVCSEAFPLAKTGGLGDVGGALPRALLKRGVQLRLLLPAYAATMAKAKAQGLKLLQTLTLEGCEVKLWQSRLPGSRVPVWLVDVPEFSAREGGLYGDASGNDWPDNAWRFYLFSRVAEQIAMNQAGLEFAPDMVHCHDWQTGLVPAFLNEYAQRPATVFTIHNLAYRGIFDHATFAALRLPGHWWHHEVLEFWGNFSFLKAGLVFADRLTTVSPSYAEEIQTAAFGCGLEGLLHHRRSVLRGLINGIDMDTWNPGSDKLLEVPYSRRSLKKKAGNKQALQTQMGLSVLADTPLLGFVGRLVEQKGVHLVLGALPELLAKGDCQFVAVGTGQHDYEEGLRALAQQFPGKVAVHIGYDESLSHRVEAGADAFLMPSLFEPCGLNQMYSQRYGTVPVCHYVGGLRDTVVHLAQSQIAGYLSGSLGLDDIDETGFLFSEPSAEALQQTLQQMMVCYRQNELWQRLQHNGMARDFSWEASCTGYIELYDELLSARQPMVARA